MKRRAIYKSWMLVLLWGLNWPAAEAALQLFPPWIFRVITLVGGGSLILCLALLKGISIKLNKTDAILLLIAAILNITFWNVLSAYSIIELNSGRAAIIGFTMPVWTVAIEFILGTTIDKTTIQSLLAGLVGLSLLIYSVFSDPTFHIKGGLLMLVAAFSWAVGTIFLRRTSWKIPTEVATGWMVFLGGVFIIPALFFFPASITSALNFKALLGLFYSMLIGIVICQTLWFSILNEIPAQTASLHLLGIPLVSVISSYFLVHAKVSRMDMLALGFLMYSAFTATKIYRAKTL